MKKNDLQAIPAAQLADVIGGIGVHMWQAHKERSKKRAAGTTG